MPDITINLDYDNNFAKLEEIIANAPEQLKARIMEIVERTAVNVVRDAKAKAPVKTGALVEHIFHVVLPNGVRIICGVHYASYQEMGTKYIEPKYFMSSSFEWWVGSMENEIVSAIYDLWEGS